MGGWIALHRSILDHWVWKDKPFSNGQAWIDLILLANHKDTKDYLNGALKIFKKGTVNRSIESLSTRWEWNRKKTRKFLNVLESDGMVTVNVTTHGTTITLVNYSDFQDIGTTKGTTEGQPRDNNVPQTTMKNNDNNINNKREENPLPPVPVTRYPAGRYQNVFLSAEEASKLQKEFPSEADPMIEKLSEYMKQNYTKYRNDAHYEIIRKWILEDRNKPKAAEPKKNKALEYDQRHYTESQISAIERKKLGLI